MTGWTLLWSFGIYILLKKTVWGRGAIWKDTQGEKYKNFLQFSNYVFNTEIFLGVNFQNRKIEVKAIECPMQMSSLPK